MVGMPRVERPTHELWPLLVAISALQKVFDRSMSTIVKSASLPIAIVPFSGIDASVRRARLSSTWGGPATSG
jgi:hypothetical protein